MQGRPPPSSASALPQTAERFKDNRCQNVLCEPHRPCDKPPQTACTCAAVLHGALTIRTHRSCTPCHACNRRPQQQATLKVLASASERWEQPINRTLTYHCPKQLGHRCADQIRSGSSVWPVKLHIPTNGPAADTQTTWGTVSSEPIGHARWWPRQQNPGGGGGRGRCLGGGVPARCTCATIGERGEQNEVEALGPPPCSTRTHLTQDAGPPT